MKWTIFREYDIRGIVGEEIVLDEMEGSLDPGGARALRPGPPAYRCMTRSPPVRGSRQPDYVLCTDIGSA